MDLLFAFPGYESLAEKISDKTHIPRGEVTIRLFPDGESYVQMHTSVRHKKICIVCGLNQPDQKAIQLMFFSNLARELGATHVGLIVPYLGYMRQDKRFQKGEAITSQIFAQFLSAQVDWLLTIDPHLHRYKTLSEIYPIPCKVLHAAELIAQWIQNNISRPLLIGPDQESRQWVAQIAEKMGAPFMVLSKIRYGDKDVEIEMPHFRRFKDHTPVIIDDIISSAQTMLQAVENLRKTDLKPAICLGIHPVFAENAYTLLENSGVTRIVSCNTITHPSNEIDVTGLISKELLD